ncbi:hypothetical protein WJX72_001479 [[Myrmecia] bisecta]|uniref:Protein transport protein SEC23 n=1 Tax=[Myrmecia] bisecta TaxID=41462 RepID=A0AAW1P9R1_9CHLO
MDYTELENTVDGLRFAWNVWPSSRIEAARIVVPLGVVVTPLKEIPDMPVLPYEPVRCKSCPCVLNPYCRVDFQAMIWVCPFCLHHNHFPQHYAQINESMLPAELFQQYAMVEYQLAAPVRSPPTFLFVVDLCLPDDELRDMKEAIKQALALLPDTALVGLISFGAMVNVHELGFSEVPKAYVFRGTRETSAAEVAKMLGLGVAPMRGKQGMPAAASAPGLGRFLLPLADCEFALESALDDLQPDASPHQPSERPLRAIGAAAGVAVGLLEACVPGCGARIMVLTGGPCTTGPGLVVGVDKAEAIRTHKDLEKGESKQFTRACKFYDGLAARLVEAGHCLDVFACALDQVGLAEMQMPVACTGGVMVLAETFGHDLFRKSLGRMFERSAGGSLQMGFNATFEVLCTKEVKIAGASGPIASLKRRNASVSDQETAVGGTCAWKLCALSPRTSLAVFFDVVNTHNAPVPDGQLFLLQFLTHYQHPDGQQRLRVVTTARRWASPGANEVAMGFDQEAAAVVMARLASYRCATEEAFDVLRWLDRMIIRLAAKFGQYQKDNADTFTLPDGFTLFPQFLFHLRRSQFLQVFNNTPDETAFYRLMLDRENVTSSLVMIQPPLLSYSFQGPPHPVLLDVQSIQPDAILLLDTYFMVILHYGTTVAQWRKARYQDQPEHQEFRDLLAAPLADAKELLKGRLPVPKLLETDQGGSQARFVLAKLNPSATHTSPAFQTSSSEVIFTDDVSLQVFLEHLARLAVQS